MKYTKNGLVAEYLRLKESGAPSDFPYVMLDAQHKMLVNAFKGFPSPWSAWCKIGNLKDFKTHNRAWLGEAQDLKKVAPGGPYKTTQMSDYGYGIALETFGRTFDLLRQTVINDDLDAFRETPAKLGRAAARTLAKQVSALLESNGAAYDGSAIFRSANSSSTALTADTAGIAALQAAVLAIATAKDPGTNEIMGLTAKYLMVSPSKAEVGKWLLSSMALVGGATTNGLQSNPLQDPALSPKLTLLVDPFLTAFPDRWYVIADPSQAHACEVGFLDGKQDPTLLMEKPSAVQIGGGDDPWGYEFDDIKYKVRHDWGVKLAFHQAIYKGGA